MTDLGSSSTIISGATYGPSSELLSIGGSYNENPHLQLHAAIAERREVAPYGSTTVNMSYAYSSTQNNGKITSQTDNISGETVVYTYDSLNRLATAGATSSSWGQSYGYPTVIRQIWRLSNGDGGIGAGIQRCARSDDESRGLDGCKWQ